MCFEEWDYSDGGKIKVDGECPDCGEDTIGGDAITGCCYSKVICKTCGSAPCDESC